MWLVWSFTGGRPRIYRKIQAACLGFLNSIFGVPFEANPMGGGVGFFFLFLEMFPISIQFSYTHYKFGAIFLSKENGLPFLYHVIYKPKKCNPSPSSYPWPGDHIKKMTNFFHFLYFPLSLLYSTHDFKMNNICLGRNTGIAYIVCL